MGSELALEKSSALLGGAGHIVRKEEEGGGLVKKDGVEQKEDCVSHLWVISLCFWEGI